jgi:hypothetical protein
MKQQVWFYNKYVELLWVCGPPFICILVVLLFPSLLASTTTETNWSWVIFVVLMDVGHVYTTLYKTYFDKQAFAKHKTLFTAVPIISFIIAFLLYQLGAVLFWRVIAYTAVFHFVRQQYGLLKIYQRHNTKTIFTTIDIVTVYAACIYPLIYWHCYGPFQFEWFTTQDFIFYKNPAIETVARYTYLAILITFGCSTLYNYIKHSYFNIASTLIIVGTILSWYLGIVYFKTDLSFTIFNIVCHGIPYMALVWMHQQKLNKNKNQNTNHTIGLFSFISKRATLFIFLLIPFAFAYVEEGLWDVFIWKEYKTVFTIFKPLQNILLDSISIVLIPLLIVPQLTHYILDGFIWKVSKGDIPELVKDV